MPQVPVPPGGRPRGGKARGRFVKAKEPGRSLKEASAETTCSDADGPQLMICNDPKGLSDSECEVFLAEGAPMPPLEQHKYVSCRPVPGGVILVLQRCLDVRGTLEELQEEVPEVDDEFDEGPWMTTKPPAQGAGPARLRMDRPHSAKRPEDMHRKPPSGRPLSATAALGARPSSARPASARPSSARPASARPSSGRPSSGRPLSARPLSARPSSARPSSAGPPSARPRPCSAPAARPTSAPSAREVPRPTRPQSAPCREVRGSVLFQQQDFLQKQTKDVIPKEAFPRCFTTLMQNWVISYQKSRIRARMACRPLFGKGSDATFSFPKSYPPMPPPLVMPKKRDLEEELEELERALAGPKDSEEEPVRPLDSVRSTKTLARRGSLILPIDQGLGLDLTNTIGKKMSSASQGEQQVVPVRTIPYENTPRGAMTPCASTVFPQMSMQSAPPSVIGSEPTASAHSEESHFLSPAFGMMPKKDVLKKAFHRLADEAEVHVDLLTQSLELLGIRHIKQHWVEQILQTVTRYTTLSFTEFNLFVHSYVELQSKEYEDAFFMLDRDGSGTIESTELAELMASIGVTPMDQVIQELIEEFDVDASGDVNLDEFCRMLAIVNEREAFGRAEFDRLKHAFDLFDDDFASLKTDALSGILGYLGYEMSQEVVEKILSTVDVDGSGSFNFAEFLFFMRKIREQEVQRLEDELQRLRRSCGDKEELLTKLLQAFGYVPDQEAVRDAAADCNINLSAVAVPGSGTRRNSQIRSSFLAPDLRVETSKSQASQKLALTLSEAYGFLEVYRHREGFTRAEAADLEALFDQLAQQNEKAKQISSLAACNCLHRLGYKALHNEHQLLFAEVDVAKLGEISLQDFLKLVRKYRQKDLEDIRASYLKMGMAARDTSVASRMVVKKSMNFLGMSDPAKSMTVARTKTERSPAQKIRDAEDQRFGMLCTAVTKRNQLRVVAQQHQGFDTDEVEALYERFLEYDSSRTGCLSSADLRTLCQDLMPDISTDPRFRPDLINILKQMDSSDGKMYFMDFLRVARELEENRRKAVYMKEQSALEGLDFTATEVHGFREIFVQQDEESSDSISFPSVVYLLGSLVPLGDRRVQQLAELWQKQSENLPPSLNTEEWTIDFSDFLLLMNSLLTLDFCGIKAKCAAIVHELEVKAKTPKLEASSHYLTTKLSLSTSSSEVMGPVASNPE